MTCIVGLESNGAVLLAGDAAISDESTITGSRLPKVWHTENGELAFGYCDSPKYAQLMQFNLKLPKLPRSCDPLRWLARSLVPALQKCFEDEVALGWPDNEGYPEIELLIGFRGRLYQMSYAYEVFAPATGYAAIGSGSREALGAIHATRGLIVEQEQLALAALRASTAHTHSVRPPYTVLRQFRRRCTLVTHPV